MLQLAGSAVGGGGGGGGGDPATHCSSMHKITPTFYGSRY